jgi:hypothetical protein
LPAETEAHSPIDDETDLTVTTLLETKSPSCVVAVMVAVPEALAVTSPNAPTVAIFGLLLDHATRLLVALAGATVAISCCCEPLAMDNEFLLNVTPETGTTALLTVTMHDAEINVPSVVVAVMIVVPGEWAVTKPVLSTLATLGLFDDH